jgi:hypothetical protein
MPRNPKSPKFYINTVEPGESPNGLSGVDVFQVKAYSDLMRAASAYDPFPFNAVDSITGSRISDLGSTLTIHEFQAKDVIDLPSVRGTITASKGKKGLKTIVEANYSIPDILLKSSNPGVFEWEASAEQAAASSKLRESFASIGPSQRAYLRIGYSDAPGLTAGTLVLMRDESNIPWSLVLYGYTAGAGNPVQIA